MRKKLIKKETKLLWEYIGPSMIGMLIAGSFSIIDTIFIGQGMGKNGLAAIAVTWPIIMFISSFGELFGAGSAVLIAQARGAKDNVLAQKSFNSMLLLQCISAIFLESIFLFFLSPILKFLGANEILFHAAFNYSFIMILGAVICMFMIACLNIIRNDGHPLISMWLLILGLFCNIILDWLFIIDLEMGAIGAALATVLSQSITCIGGFSYFFSNKTDLNISFSFLKMDWEIIKKVTVTGVPIFGNMISIITMLCMHNMQSLKYGAVNGLAAYTVVAAMESLGSILMTGLAGGIQPLTANMYGAKKYKRQNLFGNRGYFIALILGIGLMSLSILLYQIMPNWMGLDGESAKLASYGILLSAPTFLFLGIIRVGAFYYQATGKIFDASLLIYGDAFIALPLCLFTLPIGLGMDGVWLAMPISRILLFLLLCYIWFGKKRSK